MSARIPRRGRYRRAAARQAGARLCRLAAVRSSATGGPGFFTLALPVLFLVIFAVVFTGTTKVAGGSIDTSLYCVPVIITLAIISAAFGNLGPRPGPLLLHT